jgi:serine/threonine protein kinase
LRARRDEKKESLPAWFAGTGIAIIAAGVALGMRHIHSRGLVHAGLKASNILVTAERNPLISDLGRPQPSQPAASAPELATAAAFAPPADVFAFAILLFELAVGPFALSKSPKKIREEIANGKRPEIKGVTPEVERLISTAWAQDPAARPSFADIVQIFKNGSFKLLADVDPAQVRTYIEKVEAAERRCYSDPIEIA